MIDPQFAQEIVVGQGFAPDLQRIITLASPHQKWFILTIAICFDDGRKKP
jgi:hypothetical protein